MFRYGVQQCPVARAEASVQPHRGPAARARCPACRPARLEVGRISSHGLLWIAAAARFLRPGSDIETSLPGSLHARFPSCAVLGRGVSAPGCPSAVRDGFRSSLDLPAGIQHLLGGGHSFPESRLRSSFPILCQTKGDMWTGLFKQLWEVLGGLPGTIALALAVLAVYWWMEFRAFRREVRQALA